jgi:Co/Zn/Cd efflux system component
LRRVARFYTKNISDRRSDREKFSCFSLGPPLLAVVFARARGKGIMTAYTLSGWPDLIVGLGILAMNADSAREVWSAAREERRQADEII